MVNECVFYIDKYKQDLSLSETCLLSKFITYLPLKEKKCLISGSNLFPFFSDRLETKERLVRNEYTDAKDLA
jgi:hypothetical protein